MINWLVNWWKGITAEYLFYCFIASFILVGMYSCYMMPPQIVTNRISTMQRVHHHDCMAYDNKGNCSFYNNYDTIEPQWLLIDQEQRECDVFHSTYIEARYNEEKKCIQLFGWRHGVWSREFPILEQGWK